MLKDLFNQKKKDSEALSGEFENWLYKDRARQIKGIEYFLKKRSQNIDKLIIQAAVSSDLNKLDDFAIFSVGGYGREELHPFSDIDLLLLSKKNLSSSNQEKVQNFVSLLWDLGLILIFL